MTDATRHNCAKCAKKIQSKQQGVPVSRFLLWVLTERTKLYWNTAEHFASGPPNSVALCKPNFVIFWCGFS